MRKRLFTVTEKRATEQPPSHAMKTTFYHTKTSKLLTRVYAPGEPNTQRGSEKPKL